MNSSFRFFSCRDAVKTLIASAARVLPLVPFLVFALTPSFGAVSDENAYAEIPGSIVRLTIGTRGPGRYIYTRAIYFARDGRYQVLQDRAHATVDGYGDTTSSPSKGQYSTTWDTTQRSFLSLVLTPDGGGTPDSYILEFRGPSSGRYGGFMGGSFSIDSEVPVTGAANVSNRTWLAASRPSITGFILTGTEWRWVLVRVVGPGLAKFGVAPVAGKPSLQLFSGSGAYDVEVGAWAGDAHLVPGLQRAFEMVGAFALEETANDCASLYRLPAGAYTVIARNAGTEGEALTEVYVLPYGS
ncbi:hypothetical protein DB347_01750 [Opitutaceae bacterium EW11]|nr:hypothetical protein DB347_01750 [Opitutaceae bacterium EW11]